MNATQFQGKCSLGRQINMQIILRETRSVKRGNNSKCQKTVSLLKRAKPELKCKTTQKQQTRRN